MALRTYNDIDSISEVFSEH